MEIREYRFPAGIVSRRPSDDDSQRILSAISPCYDSVTGEVTSVPRERYIVRKRMTEFEVNGN